MRDSRSRRDFDRYRSDRDRNGGGRFERISSSRRDRSRSNSPKERENRHDRYRRERPSRKNDLDLEAIVSHSDRVCV